MFLIPVPKPREEHPDVGHDVISRPRNRLRDGASLENMQRVKICYLPCVERPTTLGRGPVMQMQLTSIGHPNMAQVSRAEVARSFRVTAMTSSLLPVQKRTKRGGMETRQKTPHSGRVT